MGSSASSSPIVVQPKIIVSDEKSRDFALQDIEYHSPSGGRIVGKAVWMQDLDLVKIYWQDLDSFNCDGCVAFTNLKLMESIPMRINLNAKGTLATAKNVEFCMEIDSTWRVTVHVKVNDKFTSLWMRGTLPFADLAEHRDQSKINNNVKII